MSGDVGSEEDVRCAGGEKEKRNCIRRQSRVGCIAEHRRHFLTPFLISGMT